MEKYVINMKTGKKAGSDQGGGLSKTPSRFTPPLPPNQRYLAEVELKKKLESRTEVVGGIVFSLTEKKFSYYPNTGYIEPPLMKQCAAVRLPLANLGKIRHDKFSLRRNLEEPAVPAFFFARVLKGCADVQLKSIINYLDRSIGNVDEPFTTVNYRVLTYLNRDVVVPKMKYMTRTKQDNPYLWVPYDYDGLTTVMEVDAVYNGLPDVATDVTINTEPIPSNIDQVAVVASQEGDTAKMATKPSSQESEGNAPEQGDGDDEDGDPEEGDGDEIGENVREKSDGEPEIAEPALNPGKEVYTQVEQDEEVYTPIPRPILPDGTQMFRVDEDELDSEPPNKPEAGCEKASDMFANSDQDYNPSDDDIEDDEDVFDVVPKITKKKKTKLVTRVGSDPDLDGDNVLAGQVNENADPGPPDERCATLRRLHAKLPKTIEDIGDPNANKIAFTMLLINLRPFETDYYREAAIPTRLPEINPSAVPRKREIEKEYKRICGLIRGRDKWERSQVEGAKKMALVEARAKNTKAGRTKAKRQVEIETSQRLAEKATAEARRTIDLVTASNEAEVEVEQQEAAVSMSTNSGKVLPLNNVLHRQSQGGGKGGGKGGGQSGTSGLPRSAPPADFDQTATVASTSLMPDLPSINATMNKTSENFMSMSMAGKSKAKVPKGYVKFEVASAIHDLETAVLEMTKQGTRRQQAEERRHRAMKARYRQQERKLGKLALGFQKWRDAFFEYDVASHQTLTEAQTELMSYFPLDELGPKVNFLLTNKASARSIAKKVIYELGQDGITAPSLTDLVNTAARTVFSGGLRAHMHFLIGKAPSRSTDPMQGWDMVKCPPEFETFLTRYILPLCHRCAPSTKQKTWRYKLKSHLWTTRKGLYYNKLARCSNNKEWVLKRRLERLALAQRHFVEEIEGKPLLIPTEEEELDKFVADSPLKHLPRASILARKPTHRSQNTFEDTKGAPLPTMAVLEEMTANLQILIDASCERTAHKKFLPNTEPPSDAENGEDKDDGEDIVVESDISDGDVEDQVLGSDAIDEDGYTTPPSPPSSSGDFDDGRKKKKSKTSSSEFLKKFADINARSPPKKKKKNADSANAKPAKKPAKKTAKLTVKSTVKTTAKTGKKSLKKAAAEKFSGSDELSESEELSEPEERPEPPKKSQTVKSVLAKALALAAKSAKNTSSTKASASKATTSAAAAATSKPTSEKSGNTNKRSTLSNCQFSFAKYAKKK